MRGREAGAGLAQVQITINGIDNVGRVRAYGEGVVPGDLFRHTCEDMDERCLDAGGSRWAVRALVPRDTFLAPEALVLSPSGGPLEVNRIRVTVGGEPHDYLWVARNLHDRVPGADDVDRFTGSVVRLVDFQNGHFDEFGRRTEDLLATVDQRGLVVVCNDPLGEWGSHKVDPELFASVLQQLFYFRPEDAALMVEGKGYSRHGHYVFGLADQAGDVLAMFVLARFDWGFEGTYTMINPTLDPQRTRGAARVLMLLSNALVLSRHGMDTLLYGEANIYNIKACIYAGYEVVPPRLTPRMHENIVWRDNPIGSFGRIDAGLVAEPPGYRDVPYVDYALMRARNNLILPYADFASGLVRE